MTSLQMSMAKRKIKQHYGLTYNLTDRQAIREIEGLKRKAAKERMDDMDERLYAALQVGDGAMIL